MATIDQLRAFAAGREFPFRIHFGAIASGDEDIVDSERAWELHAQTNAICVAWEGSGGARAAALNQVPFLEIRGITDSADKGAPVDFKQNIAAAILNTRTLLGEWLRVRPYMISGREVGAS